MMMPPKKSRAAREQHQAENENDQPPENLSDVSEETPVINIFTPEVLIGKRKRLLPPGEQHLKDWLGKNFVEKEEMHVNMNDTYDCYIGSCTDGGTNPVEQTFMMRVMKEMFPSGVAVKDDSSVKEDIRQRKAKKKSDQVKAPSLKLKMKDLIIETLKEMENPVRGVTFRILKQNIAGKYPALRLDIRPKILRSALDRGVYTGSYELVRGIGMAGVYRLPGPGKEPVEKKKSHKKKSTDEENKENDDENAKENGEAQGSEADEKGEGEGDKEGASGDAKSKKVKSKKKKSNKKKAKPRVVVYSEPKRLEDIFPMAMTFQMEPKEASVTKIRNYVLRHYKDSITLEAMLKCLEKGEEKGFWARVSGHGFSGTFRLGIDEFDPTDDDDLTGQVVNAILACTEPKLTSSGTLKKYILDFHPEFHVAERPMLFKKAVERAIAKGMLRQLSGIGLTGTFQLIHPFAPSPAALQGKDTASDYEVSDSDEDEVYEAPDVSQFLDAYKPRPTKRHSRKSAAGVDRLEYNIHVPKPKPPHPRKPGEKKSHKKIVYADTSEEESSDESEDSSSEEEAPPPPRKAPKKKTAAKSPAKGKGRAKARGKSPAKRKAAAPARRDRGKPKVELSDVSEEEEETPAPKVGRSKPAAKTSSSRSRSNISYIELSDSDSDIERKKATKRKSTAKKDQSSSPAAKKAKGQAKSPAKKGKGRKGRKK